MAPPKGFRPPNAGKGRQRGSQNKVTKAFKEATLRVFDRLGGDDALLAWATKNPTEFYKIAARLIPHEVSHSGEIRLPTVIDELHRE